MNISICSQLDCNYKEETKFPSMLSVTKQLGVLTLSKCKSMCDHLFNCTYVFYSPVQAICFPKQILAASAEPLGIRREGDAIRFYSRLGCAELERPARPDVFEELYARATKDEAVQKCVLPFFFAGTWYTKCAFLDVDRNWCPLSDQLNQTPFHANSKWGVCTRS